MKNNLSVLFVLLATVSLHAQSFFYNSRHFGMSSTLLGGAVAAGNDDLSMAYYNPAALHMAKPQANISLVQPYIERFGLGNFFGQEASNTNFDIDFSPSIASYKLMGNDKLTLVAITVQRSVWEQDVESQAITESGSSRAENIFEYRYRGRDRWLGAGASYQLSERLSLGFSQFISFARFEYNYGLASSTYDLLTEQRTTLFSDRLNTLTSNNFAWISKFGLQWRMGRHSLGAVITTPNYLALFPRGTFERTQVDVTAEGGQIDELVNFDLNPTVKTPWEFSIGYAVEFKDGSKFWLTGNFYPQITNYTVSTLQRIDGRQVDWVNGSRRITNFAVGYSRIINPKLELVGSFRTNFFAYDNRPLGGNQERLFVLDDDRFHMATGANFNIKGNDVLLGIDWGLTTTDNAELFAGFPNIDRFDTNESSFFNGTLTILFTYGFLFNR